MADNIPGANPSPDVAPNPLPTPFNENRVSPEEFGAGAGAELVRQSAQTAKSAGEYQDRANEIADLNVFGKAQQALNDTIISDKTGFRSLRGADALAKSDEFTGKFKMQIDTLRSSLNEAQLRRIGYRLDRVQESGIREAEGWEHQQHGVIAEATAKGAQDQILQTIATLASDPTSDPAKLKEQFGQLLEAGQKYAGFKYGSSADPKAVQAETLPMLQAAAVTAMTSVINRPGVTADQAQRVFDLPFGKQKLGDFLGQHRGTIERAMGNIRAVDTSETAGSQLIAKAIDPRTGWVDPDKAQNLLKAMPESPLKGDVMQYVHKRLQEALSFRKDQVDAHVQQMWKVGDNGEGAMDMDAVKTAAPMTYAWMQTYASKELGDIELRAKRAATAEEKANRTATPEESDAFIEAQYRMATSPEDFARMTPTGFESTYRGKLAPKDYLALGTLWREGLQKDAQGPKVLPPAVLATAVDIGREAGVFPSGKKPPTQWAADQKALYDNLNNTLLDQDAKYKRDNGKPMPMDKLREAAIEHLVGLKVPNAILPGYSVTRALTLEGMGGDIATIEQRYEIATVPGVPDDQIDALKKKLTAGGAALTGANIRKQYQYDLTKKKAP